MKLVLFISWGVGNIRVFFPKGKKPWYSPPHEING